MAEKRHLKAVTATTRTRKAPARLTGDALKLFNELAPGLRTSGRLAPEDEPMFRLFCQTMSVAAKAGMKLGDVESTGRKDARVADPAWRGFRDAAALALQIGKEYGLTPDSRSNMKARSTGEDKRVAKLLS